MHHYLAALALLENLIERAADLAHILKEDLDLKVLVIAFLLLNRVGIHLAL